MNKIAFFLLMCLTSVTFAQTILPESNIAEMELSLNKINLIHRFLPVLTGEGFTIAIKENKIDSLDIDFQGRLVRSTLTSALFSNHAADMATIMAGAGNNSASRKGIAWKAKIMSISFAKLLPESDDFYRKNQIFLENHSYGTDIQNVYNTNSIAYDASINRLNDVLHVFSSGNSGNITPTDGNFKGIANYSNLTGSFKQAKNIIAVGAVDSVGKIETRSSRGPTYDGRLKPELVAFGQDGSSGAAALVSGVATLLQQQFARNRNNVKPPSHLVKALLINSAEDVGTKGIDYQSGYGNVNAFAAVQTLNAGRFFTGEITNGVSQTYSISIPSNVKNLKITLLWNDLPATEKATIALVNDLDLSVVSPEGQRVLPWVLSVFPNADSLKKLPARRRDGLNNVEQITLQNPSSGKYSVVILGYKIPKGSQTFSVVYDWELGDEFQWQFPQSQDNLTPNENNLIRWKSTFSETKGVLEYSPNAGRSWQRVGDIDLSKGSYRWKVPNLFYTPARLRMSVANKAFLSDTFSVSKPLEIKLGYNCPDSLLLFWNTPEFINRYVIYQLGNQYLEPIIQTNRSSNVINKKKYGVKYFAVAPILDNGKLGRRSNAIAIDNQGVGCFLRSFNVDNLDDKNAQLSAELSTLNQVKYLVFQKLEGTEFKDLYSLIPTQNRLKYQYENGLLQGENTYRLKVVFQNGSEGFSNNETVFFFADNQYILYPNPIRKYDDLKFKLKNPTNEIWQLYDGRGALILQKELRNIDEIEPINLPSGMYYYVILSDKKIMASGKLAVE
ncbi:S8 family serine peptidase [Arcicella sp. LKC2W]|uniref:S8 family serine peptidase n=1 Tax=Arcicella sp. LKC2W TaxID=2984198 RepID=UPI002B1EBF71|nr:S8 family serine peptidase [Arcicella sp. LKC2W]MEA5459199.1 S8 family serine peptidase [Arcicella sp. LKC2W]